MGVSNKEVEANVQGACGETEFGHVQQQVVAPGFIIVLKGDVLGVVNGAHEAVRVFTGLFMVLLGLVAVVRVRSWGRVHVPSRSHAGR